jgi:hypothetical protein
MEYCWVIKHKTWYRARDIKDSLIVWSTSFKRAIKHKTKEEAEKVWAHKNEIKRLTKDKYLELLEDEIQLMTPRSQNKEMITPENITRKQAKKLVKLLKREAQCAVMVKLGRFDNLEFAEYAVKQIEYKNKIRELLFGTSNIIELAEAWDMCKNVRQKQKRRRKTNLNAARFCE